MFDQALILSFLALGQIVSSLPTTTDLSVRQWIGVAPPPKDQPSAFCPEIERYEAVDGEPWQTGNSAGSGASLSISTGYTAGTIIAVGADLHLALDKLLPGLAGGISFGYSEIVTKTVTLGSNIDCPQKKDGTDADYSCSLIVTPGYVRLIGKVKKIAKNADCEFGFAAKEGPWDMIVPRIDSTGNPFYYTDTCLCEGQGMDQENAPSLKCLESCTGAPNDKSTQDEVPDDMKTKPKGDGNWFENLLNGLIFPKTSS